MAKDDHGSPMTIPSHLNSDWVVVWNQCRVTLGRDHDEIRLGPFNGFFFD